MVKCPSCGEEFDNKPRLSRAGDLFTPRICFPCWKIKKSCTPWSPERSGYCADCEWFMREAPPGSVARFMGYRLPSGKTVPFRNYCRSRRTQPAGIHPFFVGGFQDSTPCIRGPLGGFTRKKK